jgi:tetratricopeptide (TPR) repeat protein
MSNVPDVRGGYGLFPKATCLALLLLVAGKPAFSADSSLVDVAIERGDYPAAVEMRRQEARHSGDPASFDAAARLAYDWSQYSVLTAICGDWLRKDPQSEQAHRYLAVAALELDQRDTAVRELDWLLTHVYQSLNVGFDSFGTSLGELRNRAGLSAVMANLSARHPEAAAGHLQAGDLALAAGDAAQALREAQRASELGRRRVGRSLAARAHVIMGDCEQGLALAAPLGTDVHDSDRLTEGWLLEACDRGAEAEAIFQELSAHSSERASALEALAGRELETRRNEAAARHYTELAKLGGRESAQFGMATVAERAGDRERAATLYAGISSGRHAVEAQLRAYRLRLTGAGIDWADRLLDDFLTSNSSLRQDITVGRILALADVGQTERALALASRVERAYPDVEEFERAHAEVLVRAGRTDDAITRLERLLAARPHDPAALNALGYTLAEAGRDLRRAEKLLVAAVAQAPDNAAYLDSLGWLRFQQRDYTAAVGALARAYLLQPDPEIAAHSVAALDALGDRVKADDLLQSALDRHPGEQHLVALQHRRRGEVPR